MAASHEIVETVTDPYAGKPGKTESDTSMLGYDITTSDALPVGAGACRGARSQTCAPMSSGSGATAGRPARTRSRASGRIASAAASHDPCVPAPAGEVYFNTAPAGGNDALSIGVGKSVMFELDAFSDGPTADWTVGVVDLRGDVAPPRGAACDANANVVCFALSGDDGEQRIEGDGSPRR